MKTKFGMVILSTLSVGLASCGDASQQGPAAQPTQKVENINHVAEDVRTVIVRVGQDGKAEFATTSASFADASEFENAVQGDDGAFDFANVDAQRKVSKDQARGPVASSGINFVEGTQAAQFENAADLSSEDDGLNWWWGRWSTWSPRWCVTTWSCYSYRPLYTVRVWPYSYSCWW